MIMNQTPEQTTETAEETAQFIAEFIAANPITARAIRGMEETIMKAAELADIPSRLAFIFVCRELLTCEAFRKKAELIRECLTHGELPAYIVKEIKGTDPNTTEE